MLGDRPDGEFAEGKLRFETTAVTGAFTLYEGPGLRVLRGDGTDRDGGRPFSIQLSQRISTARGDHRTAARGDLSRAYVLLIVE